jgi:hypothetical protein
MNNKIEKKYNELNECNYYNEQNDCNEHIELFEIQLLEKDMNDLNESFILAGKSIHEQLENIDNIDDYINKCKNDIYISNLTLKNINESNNKFTKMFIGSGILLLTPFSFIVGGVKLGILSIGVCGMVIKNVIK